MKENRDLLRSGTYKASGRIMANRRSFGEKQRTVEIFSAFDLDKGLFRFDGTEPVNRRIDGDAIPDQQITKYVRTPALAITWIKPWGRMHTAVGIHPPTIKLPPIFSPFDVRSLGLGLWDDFRAGASFDRCYETWDKSRWLELVPEANGVYRLRLERGGRRGTYVPQTLWVDEQRGFAPIRLTYSIPPVEPGQPEQLISECQVRWKKEADAWAPASVHFERRIRGQLNDFYSLSFEWISVNKPIQPGLFRPDGLGVPAGTPVVDYRTTIPRRFGELQKRVVPR